MRSVCLFPEMRCLYHKVGKNVIFSINLFKVLVYNKVMLACFLCFSKKIRGNSAPWYLAMISIPVLMKGIKVSAPSFCTQMGRLYWEELGYKWRCITRDQLPAVRVWTTCSVEDQTSITSLSRPEYCS